MAALTTTTERQTYRRVPLIQVRYFRALCVIARGVGDYEILEENERPGEGQTFSVEVWGIQAYNLMQEVFEAANG